jgi:hypothetical protein
MDLTVRQRRQCGKAEALSKCVDASMTEEAYTIVVRLWNCWVVFEAAIMQSWEVV